MCVCEAWNINSLSNSQHLQLMFVNELRRILASPHPLITFGSARGQGVAPMLLLLLECLQLSDLLNAGITKVEK